MGFVRSANEPTVYRKYQGVEDVLLLCLLREFKQIMLKTFEMTDLGLMRYFLGLEVKQSNSSLFVSQGRYAKDLLSKVGMLHCKPVGSPMNSNEKLHLQDCSGDSNPSKYRMLIGRLLYLTHT